MADLFIKNGALLEPSARQERLGHLLLRRGEIAKVLATEEEFEKELLELPDATVLDANGKMVAPGFVDTNCQLREPGHEEDETIAKGTAAAVAGGYTTIAALPNTDPPLDTPEGIEYLLQKGIQAGNCRVVALGSLSKGRKGKELAEMGALVAAGAVGFTEATAPLANTELFQRALEYSLMFGVPIFDHPEEPVLSRNGVMHEGAVSLVLGLDGISAESEDVVTGRDIRLAEATGGKVHLLGVSTSGSLDQLRRAKERGIPITAGISPVNFVLTDEVFRSFGSQYKVKPPIRSQDHVDACLAALADGTIDLISSGHSPRAAEKKMQELDQAPFGHSAIETVLPLVGEYLVDAGYLTWLEAIEKMSTTPARLLGLEAGSLKVGSRADITIFDPKQKWVVGPETLVSEAKSSPFSGKELTGKVTHTIVGGRVVYGDI
ncbi:MAG: dihydroorotase [Pirellulaceae bacterium]|nr:dihydroorotase [Pirellulaceae bacterium]